MSRAKQEKIKAQFRKLDKNGDNCLDLKEMGALLNKGGTFSDSEIKALFDACDLNGDKRVDFDEFLKYIYKQDKSGGGRHARLAAASEVEVDDSEGDWGHVKQVFDNYAGQDMDGREFSKFCKDNGLFDKKFKSTNCDIIFSKVVPKGKRRMDFGLFQNACRHIATQKECSVGDLQGLLAGAEGPVIHGTKGASRFHDDKSTYTGSHVYNEHHEGVDAGASHGRHERVAAATKIEADPDNEIDWAECDRVFNAFAMRDGTLDSHEFDKMCHDIPGLMGHGFAARDIDLAFTQAIRGHGTRTMNNAVFQDAIRIIAKKRNEATSEVQAIVGESDGPTLHATKALATRFHDDKSLYTGSHYEGASKDDRHARLHADRETLETETEEEHEWGRSVQVFDIFAAKDGVLDGTEFYKMMNDCGIIKGSFQRTHCDTVFAAAKGKARAIGPAEFKVAIRSIAKRKDQPVWKVQQQVENCEGPSSTGTVATANRFHDDEMAYTGSHVGKHIG